MGSNIACDWVKDQDSIMMSFSWLFAAFDNGTIARTKFLELVEIPDKNEEDIMKKLKKMTWETMLPHINAMLKVC